MASTVVQKNLNEQVSLDDASITSNKQSQSSVLEHHSENNTAPDFSSTFSQENPLDAGFSLSDNKLNFRQEHQQIQEQKTEDATSKHRQPQVTFKNNRWSTRSGNPIDRLVSHLANLLKKLEQKLLRLLEKKGPLKMKRKINFPNEKETGIEQHPRKAKRKRFFRL